MTIKVSHVKTPLHFNLPGTTLFGLNGKLDCDSIEEHTDGDLSGGYCGGVCGG